MADAFFNYVIPVIIIVNVIAVISLGVDYFRSRKSNLKRTWTSSRPPVWNYLKIWKRFHYDTKKIPAGDFEAVSSESTDMSGRGSDITSGEYLTHPNPEQTSARMIPQLTARISCMSHTTGFRTRVGKQVAIRDTYHQLLSHIVDRGGGNCKSIFGLIDNI